MSDSGDDWDASDYEGAPAAAKATVAVPAVSKGKFADEDAEDAGNVKESWDDSDDEAAASAAPAKTGPAPPVRQKGITKAKIAEKEAAEKARLEAAIASSKEDPLEKRKREMQQQIAADLESARSLFGDASVSAVTGAGGEGSNGDSSGNPLFSVPNPKTKTDYESLSENISKSIIDLYGDKPLYAHFVDDIVRKLCMPLKDLDVKKAASTLSALGNEKQKLAKEAVGGKKGKKGKPQLGTVAGGGGAAKTAVTGRGYSADLEMHDTALDDDYDDFM